MEYIIVFTHNPQDYFNGCECPDLLEIRAISLDDLSATIKPMIEQGYHAIVFPEM